MLCYTYRHDFHSFRDGIKTIKKINNETIPHVNIVVKDVTTVSKVIARNVREGRSVVGAATCGNPVQNPNANENEEPEPIHDIQPEPVVDVGPSIVEQQINGGRPSLLLRMFGF